MKTQGEDDYLQAKKRASAETNPANSLVSVLLTAKFRGKKIPLFKPFSLLYFVMVALAN